MFDFKIGIFVAFSACFFVYIHSQPRSQGVGTSCFVPQDCGLWHFVCENSVCKCDAEHIPDKENKWCAVDIFEACGYHDECYDYDSNAECVGVAIPKYGSCQCKKGFTFHEKRKVCSAVIGNNCTVDDDCIEGTCKLALPCQNGACNYTQCFCNEPLQANVNGSQCLPALDDDCSAFNKCARENAICNNEHICECDVTFKKATRENETYCLAMLDNSCKNTTDCADIGGECVVKNKTEEEPPCCKTNRNTYWPEYPPKDPPEQHCVCGEGFVRHPNISECLEVATNLNDSCVHDIQCSTYSGFGSECKDKVCKCKNSFYFDVDFDRCVRSCICTDEARVNEIVGVLKELAPTLEALANKNNLEISGIVKKIKYLVN